MPTAMARGDGKEGPISPHQAPLLERLSSRDEDTVEDELNEDLGYPTLGTGRRNWLDRATDRSSSVLKWLRQITRGRYEDWLFLFLLGSLMGLYSFGIDLFVSSMQRYRLAAFMAAQGLAAQIITWFILTAGIAIIVALTLSWFIPTAAGSGFPELKAYLQGVKMENAFSPFTCMGKLVFLPIILSSALPLGREGPMTHVAAIFALFITKIFKDISVEELERHTGNELVAAACTIGVAVTYGAPVGGVLFSIEATRTYFAVRNYWRGFFAAVCGTVFYKGLSQMYLGIDILPMYKETYTEPLPFNFEFLGISIAIGLLCGLLGPGWVWLHRHLGYLLQKLNSMSPVCRCCCTSPKPPKDEKAGGQAEQKQQKKKRSCSLGVKTHPVTVFRCLYNIGICLVIAAAVLPWRDGYSPLMSHISGRQQMTDLMANISWKLPPLPSPSCVSSEEGDRPNCTAGLPCPAAEDDPEDCEDPAELTDHQKATRDRTEEIAARWTDDFALDYRAVLVLYALFYAFGTLLCASVTLPTGALIPSFKVGVAIGRLLGEFYCTYRMSVCLPNPAVISGFACMCGAALTGAITHSISISVIVFELTGQITYVLPILISVLVANALARHLQPSFFDSVIKSKKITVLPKMVLSKIPGGYANIRAQDLMSTEFRVFTQRATLNSLRKMVRYVHDPAKVLPLVDDEVSMEPLGLVHVRRVRRLLREELGQMAWNRDKPRVYLTMNAFKALDWDRVRNAPAVGQLGLEIDRPGSTSPRPGSPAGDTASPTVPRRNSAGQLAFEDSHPETYCTVNTGLMDGVKARLMARKRGPAHLIVPRRPINVRGQRAGPEAPSGPLTTVQETPHEPAPAAGGRRSRFVIRRVEESAATSEAEKEPLMAPEIHVNGAGEGQKCNGSAGEADDSAISSGDVTTATPSDGSRGHRRSASDALLQSSTHPDGTPGRKASDPNDVYDSLVSNCSRASRLRDGIAKMLPKRSGNLNLEERKQNAQQRLNRQFSLSDLHQGEGDTMNMTQFFQRTLDRTSNIFSGMKSTEPSETEVRLRRAWRRRQLNREVELREVIEIDPFPLAVNVDTPLVQIHKMFAMLCANRMYVMDRRRLVGCLTLKRLSEFITRGCVDQPAAPPAAEPDKHPPPVARRDSQDTLDDVDEGVYDTITEPPGPLPTAAAAATSAV
ncbi:Chloride channel protein 2 [Amphibalanus amphitrite]|uniref:Chloride channel protein 2 n=1 Tax=Amphibalanus amphitrite TaxID=1232801 RepID=A0A6A4VNF0_AMPAM|nr:Chloride channel protein 2 [Amphibalanus amphitrite]